MELTGFGTGLKRVLEGMFQEVCQGVVELTGFGTGLKPFRLVWCPLACCVVELTGFGTGLKLTVPAVDVISP